MSTEVEITGSSRQLVRLVRIETFASDFREDLIAFFVAIIVFTWINSVVDSVVELQDVVVQKQEVMRKTQIEEETNKLILQQNVQLVQETRDNTLENLQVIQEEPIAQAANQSVVSAGNDEFQLLCKVVYAESGGQPYSDQVRVAETIVKRVQSSRYPNSITEVVMAPGQFEVIRNGRVVNGYGNEINFDSLPEKTIQAAREALDGSNYLPVESELQFRGSNGQMWFF